MLLNIINSELNLSVMILLLLIVKKINLIYIFPKVGTVKDRKSRDLVESKRSEEMEGLHGRTMQKILIIRLLQ